MSRGRLADFYDRVDSDVAELERRNAGRLRCKLGCVSCCRDDITVFTVEADEIRAANTGRLRGQAPHPPGACAFLGGDGRCRIYERRPYVCRTQGLPLRWLDHDARVERRDICPVNEDGPALETLPPEHCLELGPREDALREIEGERGDGSLERVSLRALFDELAR